MLSKKLRNEQELPETLISKGEESIIENNDRDDSITSQDSNTVDEQSGKQIQSDTVIPLPAVQSAPKTNKYFFLISAFIIVFDQITKYLIRANLDYGEIIRVTPKWLWITYVKNTGAAFSLSFGSAGLNKIIFITVSIIATVILIHLIRKTQSKIELLSYSLILGGAIGNLIDRIFLGSVTDFIWCDFPDIIMRRWPVFNIADSSIVVAITIMIIFSLFFSKKPVADK